MSSPTHVLAAALAGFLLAFAARTLLPSPAPTSRAQQQDHHHHHHDAPPAAAAERACARSKGNDAAAGVPLPLPVAEALVHYATSNVTPQQTADEIGVTLRVLQRRAPCNLLVFGLGHDSAMWAALNHGGRTAFLEEDASWVASVRSAHPALESHLVAYDTVLADAAALLPLRDDPACVAQDLASAAAASCGLVVKGMPPVVGEVEWDVVMVDAPTGYHDAAPGRMGAIYAAGMAARARRPGGGPTDVLVHDVDRPVEDAFSRAFLCEGYIAEEVGRIRHFVIPSHREKDGTPFCP